MGHFLTRKWSLFDPFWTLFGPCRTLKRTTSTRGLAGVLDHPPEGPNTPKRGYLLVWGWYGPWIWQAGRPSENRKMPLDLLRQRVRMCPWWVYTDTVHPRWPYSVWWHKDTQPLGGPRRRHAGPPTGLHGPSRVL